MNNNLKRAIPIIAITVVGAVLALVKSLHTPLVFGALLIVMAVGAIVRKRKSPEVGLITVLALTVMLLTIMLFHNLK